MANPQSVGRFTLASFGNGRIARANNVLFNTVGSNVVSLPILSGGLSNSGGVIIRRITVNNPSGDVSGAYVTISTDAAGSNLVVANVALTQLNGTNKFTDLTIAAPYLAAVPVVGSITSALYVNVTTGSGNTNTANIDVYGDVVSF